MREDGSGSVTVGNLIEAVLGRDRPYPNLLEEDIIPRIARHYGYLVVTAGKYTTGSEPGRR